MQISYWYREYFTLKIFAWVIFSVVAISLDTVMNVYVMNMIKIRIMLTVFSVPVFYLIKKIVIKQNDTGSKSA